MAIKKPDNLSIPNSYLYPAFLTNALNETAPTKGTNEKSLVLTRLLNKIN
jgi:hypothetical protein